MKMKHYIKSEQVCTTRKHDRLLFEMMSLGPMEKGSTHLSAKGPLRNKYLMEESTCSFKHDITKVKGHDIIYIGQQVIQLIAAGSVMRKHATVLSKLDKSDRTF
jgi:hypothetical protein